MYTNVYHNVLFYWKLSLFQCLPVTALWHGKVFVFIKGKIMYLNSKDYLLRVKLCI